MHQGSDHKVNTDICQKRALLGGHYQGAFMLPQKILKIKCPRLAAKNAFAIQHLLHVVKLGKYSLQISFQILYMFVLRAEIVTIFRSKMVTISALIQTCTKYRY